MRLFLFLICLGTISANADSVHRGLAEEAPAPLTVGGTILMPAPVQGTTAEPPTKGSKAQQSLIRVPSEILAYLFVTGPGSDEEYTRRLAKLIKDLNPPSRILFAEKFKRGAMHAAAENLYKEPEGTSVKLQVIVNSEVLTGKELTFRSHEGELTETSFAEVVREIDRKLQVIGVSFQKNAEVAKAHTETILLTSSSGKADCIQYPGGVFGITSSESSRSQERLDRWVQILGKGKGVLFPKDAQAWWEEWGRTSARSLAHVKDPGNVIVSQYWHCRPKMPEKIVQEEWL